MALSKLAESSLAADPQVSSDPLQQAITSVLSQFDRAIASYFIFNTLFLIIGFAEFILLLFFFTFLIQSAVLALSLAIVFLTFSSYFILRLYLQANKADQLDRLKEQFIQAYKDHLHYQEGNPAHFVALANACTKLSDRLNEKSYRLYRLPDVLQVLDPYLKKFRNWCYWQDVHRMQELLLQQAVKENIKLVKCEPTSLEAHANLANAYVVLSTFYAAPQKNPDYAWFLTGSLVKVLQDKFRNAAKCAVEELKILNDFAPNDLWVHAQLAYSYRDLEMPMEEIREYEIMLKLHPEDSNTVFKLGVLYFQQGLNAQGLKMYGQLKFLDTKKASDLITYYGAY